LLERKFEYTFFAPLRRNDPGGSHAQVTWALKCTMSIDISFCETGFEVRDSAVI
jgi:hypothetical protein